MPDVLKQTIAKRKRFTVVGSKPVIKMSGQANEVCINHILATDARTAEEIALAVPDRKGYVALAVFSGFQTAL